MDLIYWPLCSSSKMEGEGVEGIVTFASSEWHFIKVHGKLVQHPSNNLSIATHYIYISIHICHILQTQEGMGHWTLDYTVFQCVINKTSN